MARIKAHTRKVGNKRVHVKAYTRKGAKRKTAKRKRKR